MIVKNLSVYKTNHLIIIHRDVNSKDNFDKIINVFLTKNYGRSKIIFGVF